VSKRDDIVAQAREYVDATRYFHEVSNYINSLRTMGVARLLRAQSQDERDQISAEQKEHINRSIGEAQRRISSPILSLNQLVEADDEPVYFKHGGRELMVIPRSEELFSYREFEVRPRGGGPETSL
jgi:hypothetical protein